jgi:transcriptional regulator with XRE-family HTH domain
LKKKKAKDKTLESISSRLRQIRQQLGCGQYRMAQMIGIGEMTYGKNERGLHLPTTRHLMALHHRLGISIEWFLFGHGPMYWEEIRDKKDDHLDDSFAREVNEMISLMERIPLLHHSIMMHYQQFKIDNKTLIREHLEEEKKEPDKSPEMDG